MWGSNFRFRRPAAGRTSLRHAIRSQLQHCQNGGWPSERLLSHQAIQAALYLRLVNFPKKMSEKIIDRISIPR
jgi:hypothetical protein